MDSEWTPHASDHNSESRTINVILFGEAGVGKSSVINLIAQNTVAKVTSDVDICTMQSTRYDVSFDGMDFAIFDTMGLGGPQIPVNHYLKAIEEAYELITKLNATGGIHLLLFCMRGGGITSAMQANYRLLSRCFGNPGRFIAFVITGLEHEVEMEDWWKRNQSYIEQCGLRSGGHACVMAVEDVIDPKFPESQKKIRELLRTCSLKLENEDPVTESSAWLTKLAAGLRSMQRRPKGRNVMHVLTHRCKLDPETARKITELVEKDDTESISGSQEEQVGDKEAKGEPSPAGGRDESGLVDGKVAKSRPDRLRSDVEARPPMVGLESGVSSKRMAEECPSAISRDGVKTKPRAASEDSEKVALPEETIRQLRAQLAEARREANSLAQVLHVHEQKHQCEALYAQGETIQAAKSHLEIVNTMGDAVKANKLLTDWVAEFTNRCIPTLERIGDAATSNVEERDKGILAYSVLLSLCPPTSNNVLTKWARIVLKFGSADDALNASTEFKLSRPTIYHTICDVLEGDGRIMEAIVCLQQIRLELGNKAVKADKLETEWISAFTNRCISTLERIRDRVPNDEERDKVISAYSILLSLGPPTPDSVLAGWARMILVRGSVEDALNASVKFKFSRSIIYRMICDVLEGNGSITEAITCFRQMQSELGDKNIRSRAEWELGFQRRCAESLDKFGASAMDSKDYNKAAEHYAAMLALDSVNRADILIKRSKARALMNSWKDALSDADEAVKLDPSSHQGHEMRHAALHVAGRYAEAVEAFHEMLSKLKESPDEDIHRLRFQYFDAANTIHRIVKEAVRDMPQVLIDTTTGTLYDKEEQEKAFATLPIHTKLVSSMTKRIDEARIRREVEEFYRYVMLSHKWEYGEPLLREVQHITVYKLESSATNMKLKDFCELVRSLGFRWAWCDTCCVDKENKRVLEESLVAMFTWYRGSSLTIVYLRDVSSLSQKRGCLQGSIWNTRAWTYQEYVAAKVVQFYTEDWKPYLGLSVLIQPSSSHGHLFNHKDSPVIVSEMQQAAAGSAKDITVLHPGLDKVREKLSLASMRQATLVEDVAYSLLGIFKASILVQYGERDRAVGRLLEYVLTGSKDVMILAWTGRAGGYSSYLPIDLTVYNQVLPPHVPQPIENSGMNKMVTALRSSLSDLTQAESLYNHLEGLPPPVSLSSRMQLSGIVFRLTDLVHVTPNGDTKLHVYRSTTSIFGDVEIATADELARTKHLHIMHPWIRPLLDQEFMHGAADLDHTTQAVRFVVRLKQRFGAFLLEQVSRVEYKRVAADHLTMVQFGEKVSLTDLIKNVRTIEIQ